MNRKTISMSLALVVCLTACTDSNDEVPETRAEAVALAGVPQPFPGGPFEASGVVHVADGGAILFVDDNETESVAWMALDESGHPTGRVRFIPWGVKLPDPEDIAFDGDHYYAMGSQSGKKSGRKPGLIRFKFDPVSQTVSGLEIATGLRDLLEARFPKLSDLAEAGDKDGLNIEGLAWHAGEKALLLGLRSPRAGADAMVMKLRLRDPGSPLSKENLEVIDEPITMPLDGSGIRGLHYDPAAERLLVIAGPTELQKDRPFSLWEWKASTATRLKFLDSRLKPEGLSLRGESLVIVCDASRLLMLQLPPSDPTEPAG